MLLSKGDIHIFVMLVIKRYLQNCFVFVGCKSIEIYMMSLCNIFSLMIHECICFNLVKHDLEIVYVPRVAADVMVIRQTALTKLNMIKLGLKRRWLEI